MSIHSHLGRLILLAAAVGLATAADGPAPSVGYGAIRGIALDAASNPVAMATVVIHGVDGSADRTVISVSKRCFFPPAISNPAPIRSLLLKTDRSQVDDTERGITFQVASLFINVELAESTLELALQNLKSFQDTVDISETQYKSGAISENDYLKIKLQLLQFETDVQQTQFARVQALSDLRQVLGYESVPADYDISAAFDYQPLLLNLDELQRSALQNRPDLRAATQGVTAANSQYTLAKANSKQDVTVSGNYSHVNGLSAATVLASVPLAIFDRNQGEIARTRYAITQAQEQQTAATGQVLTDVRDAFEGLQTNDNLVQKFRRGYLDVSQRNRDISEYAYRRGASSLLDFLDAERSYRATQLAYRQTLAAYLLAVEQVRQAVGTRSLP